MYITGMPTSTLFTYVIRTLTYTDYSGIASWENKH